MQIIRQINREARSGISFIEVVLAVAVMGIVSVIALKNLDMLKWLVFQNLQATRLLGVHQVNNEIIRTVRGAKRIIPMPPVNVADSPSVAFDRLELDIFNDDFPHSIENTDNRWLTDTKKIVYRFEATPVPRILKESYDTTAVLVSTQELFKDDSLIPPTNTQRLFTAINVDGERIGGVSVGICMKSPLFKRNWTPHTVEALVYGREF